MTLRNLPPAGSAVESVTVTVRRLVPESDTVLRDPRGRVVAPPVLIAMSVQEFVARVDDDCTV